MSTTYNYVVLRLAPDQMRGEVINVGIALWGGDAPMRIITMATLNKLRALDATWDSARLTRWVQNIELLCSAHGSITDQLACLERFGFCEAQAIGMFTADTEKEAQEHLTRLRATYVSNKSKEDQPKREKRTRLQKALRDQFGRMQVLGSKPEDLFQHLVVPNLPVPSQPELKTDFVYKNGVYRITQTIDYHVQPDGIHHKLMEACVKSTAAELAKREYGNDTRLYAVLDIPQAYEDAADSHIDLLLAKGFEVFHFGAPADMEKYISQALPAPH
jgi:hypothetical protein